MLSPLGAVVAMKESYDDVEEDAGSKQVCAVVENEGSVAFSFNINLDFDSPLDSAGVYYIARIILRHHYHNNIYIRISFSSFTDINDDFVLPSREYLTFEPMNPESCVNVAIRDSVDLEMPESFFVTLQKPSGLDERISINTDEDETEIEIIDDDSA